MQLRTLHDLYMDELNDLHSVENQLLKALPKMAAATSNTELRAAFEDHLVETQGHVDRLERIFASLLGASPNRKTCRAMEELVEQGQRSIGRNAEPAVLNAGLIATAQRVEHYEIAGYGSARRFARALGYDKAAGLLQQTLEEEGAANSRLAELAETTFNEAMHGADEAAETQTGKACSDRSSATV
jgi:ferritin-like metal-binding protein YciE